MESYEFAEKLYVDDKHRAHRCHMLLVGHYSRKSGGPPVWARATGERVCYYLGAGTQVNPLVQDIHSSKVYYDPPFSIIGGSQDYSNARPGMNPERKLERAVVESAINLIFLASGRLEKVFDVVNPDLLALIKRARLFDHFSSYETEMRAELEHEMLDLRAQLEEQKAKTNAAKERHRREKTKRREAQVQSKAWKRKYTTQQDRPEQAVLDVKLEEEEEEEEEQDWKSMLFEQERQTEHYKVKFIAIKEQKVQWDMKQKKMSDAIYALESKIARLKNQIGNLEASSGKQKEKLVKQSRELAKETEARIFWQRKHADLLADSRDHRLHRTNSAARQDQDVRAPLYGNPTSRPSAYRTFNTGAHWN
ncbi:unnamed protein product [Alternaria sp. RS040]